jgi:hypothetical protein
MCALVFISRLVRNRDGLSLCYTLFLLSISTYLFKNDLLISRVFYITSHLEKLIKKKESGYIGAMMNISNANKVRKKHGCNVFIFTVIRSFYDI